MPPRPALVGPFELDTVVQGDCVELLRQLPSASVDLVFADPPYNLQLGGELYRPNQTKVAAVDDDWDKFADFAAYDAFCRAWLAECRRVLKPTGSLWVIGSYHNIFRVGTLLQDLGFWLLNDIVWIKTNPMPNFKGTRFNNAHETLIWAAPQRQSRYTFHYHALKVMNDDLQMRSDWVLPICQGPERLKLNGQKAHATQKPAELLYRVILATSDPGQVVLDPFFGTGTTGAVAKQLGRRFLGFEQDAGYVQVARQRLAQVQPLAPPLLVHEVEKKKPRVPFGQLVASGLVPAGSELRSADGRHRARVAADGSLLHPAGAGSIHRVSAQLLGKTNYNGWAFWLTEQNGQWVSIDDLRHAYAQANGLG
jgi:DNA modification methylase